MRSPGTLRLRSCCICVRVIPPGLADQRRVELLGESVAQLGAHVGRGPPAARCLLDPPLAPAVLAVRPAAVRQRLAALPARRRERRLDGLLARFAGGQPLVECGAMVRARQWRPARYPRARVLGERVRGPLDHGCDMRAPDLARFGELLGESRRDPAGALASLDELARRERPLSEQREQVGVNRRPAASMRSSASEARLSRSAWKMPRPGSSPSAVTREDRLGFEQRIAGS